MTRPPAPTDTKGNRNMTQRNPRNTTRAMQDNPPKTMVFLGSGALAGETGQSLQAKEAAGQREMVNATVIPTMVSGAVEDDLIRLGFTIGPAVDGDSLFREMPLPDGWSREAGEEDRWSYLDDELSRRRANMKKTSLTSYVRACIEEDRVPVLDEERAPLEHVLAALDEIRADATKREARVAEIGLTGAAEGCRQTIARCEALRAALTAAAEDTQSPAVNLG